MTNFEKIKNMSVEELAQVMDNAISDCDWCPINKFCKIHDNDHFDEFITCSNTWMQWLKSEVEE